MLEERGYRRDQVGSLTRLYIEQVLWHPRDEKTRRLRMPPPRKAPLSERDEWYWLLRLQGLPPESAHERVAEIIQEKREKAKARRKRHGP
jgi:hypothetical protein